MAAQPSDAAANLRDGLVADHRRLEDALTRVLVALEAVDPQRTASEWECFDRSLTAHLDAEDHYLLPALSASRPRDARSLLHEHRHVRTRVSELGNAIRAGTLRVETVRGFVDELSAHGRRETVALYEWADDELEASDREAVLRAVAETARQLSKRAGREPEESG
jgi:hypothetical protein